MTLGPVMADIGGTSLNHEDRKLLRHANVGGVILFARNFESREQLCALCDEIHALRKPRLLVGVDHEGGRVQRFQEGFNIIPPMPLLGDLYTQDKREAKVLTEEIGWLVAVELLATGIDLSFSPNVDIRRTQTGVVGDRAFHRDPEVVAALGAALMRGLRRGGMAAVAKHYPGHGGVAGDSHTSEPIDERDLALIEAEDLKPFEHLINNNIDGILTTHVVFPRIDPLPATYSRIWLKDHLRQKLGFQGAVFSDDLGMAAAAAIGGPLARGQRALEAGCDMILPCNNREACTEIVEGLDKYSNPVSQMRFVRLHGKKQYDWPGLEALSEWKWARQKLEFELGG